MRNLFAKLAVLFVATALIASLSHGQNRGGGQGRGGQAQTGGQGSIGGAGNAIPIPSNIPRMPNAPGPAPKRDLNGAWIGVLNAARTTIPPMTPAGEARFKMNKSQGQYTLANTNDPFVTCDPLGLTRGVIAHAFQNRQGVWFEQVPNRMVILQQYQRFWRDIWMDGRALPAKVDARGFPDSRYYGYSVGHWEDDYTFVIDTVGVDEKTWLDEDGHPQSNQAKFQERYKRVDQYNIQFTMAVDDSKYYTKPFELINGQYYWMQKQDFEEALCIPSDAIAYREDLATPAGSGK